MTEKADGAPINAQTTAETVYRSRYLLVKAAHRGSQCCFVTFDSYTESSDLDRAAFGERFLAGQGISAVHVVNARNSWYHELDWREAIETARAQSAHYSRVVTYGSSMGAYAALLFADRLGASSILALSPQYSHDPRKAPFETRWPEHRRHKWLPELSAPLAGNVPAIVAYDPVVPADRLHVERIATEVPIDPLTLPHAGHVSAAFLAECGLLSELVLAVADGDVDLTEFRWRARIGRKQSLHYLIGLSDAAHRRGRHQIALDLARRIVELQPQAEIAWHYLGHFYSRLDRHDEAVAAHARASDLAPHSVPIQVEYAFARRRLGDLAGALQILRRIAGTPLPAALRRKLVAEIWRTCAHWLQVLACSALGLPKR